MKQNCHVTDAKMSRRKMSFLSNDLNQSRKLDQEEEKEGTKSSLLLIYLLRQVYSLILHLNVVLGHVSQQTKQICRKMLAAGWVGLDECSHLTCRVDLQEIG